MSYHTIVWTLETDHIGEKFEWRHGGTAAEPFVKFHSDITYPKSILRGFGNLHLQGKMFN